MSDDCISDEPKHYASSSRGSTKVLQLKLIEDIVLGLMEEEDAWPFLRPVNKKDVSQLLSFHQTPQLVGCRGLSL